jgi:TonB family protein
VRIGVAMSSTTSAGQVDAPVGNTLYGKAPERASDPAGAPARADHYLPPTQVTSLPEPIECDMRNSPYPEEAKRLGFEGEVKLRVTVDEQGRVKAGRVISDPGHGLGQQAIENMKQLCRFRPARRNEEPVTTEIPYTVRFELQ